MVFSAHTQSYGVALKNMTLPSQNLLGRMMSGYRFSLQVGPGQLLALSGIEREGYTIMFWAQHSPQFRA